MLPNTKTMLLDSAERAARSMGCDGFSYADLARDVGIRKASIHYHFPTKADLLLGLMKRYHRNLAVACAEIDQAHETAGARLRALADVYRGALGDGSSLCLCVSLTISRETLAEEVVGEIRAFRRMMADWVETVFELGAQDGTIAAVAQPKKEAAAALSLLEGAQLGARAEESTAPFDMAIQVMLARLS